MRIAHVVRRLDVGGLEVGVVNVVKRLAQSGCDQLVVCLEEAGVLAEQLPRSVTCARGRSRRRIPFAHATWAAGVLRRFSPDVVHARNVGAWIDGGLGWLLSGGIGKLAFSIHGFEVEALSWRRRLSVRLLSRLTHGLAAVSASAALEFSTEVGLSSERFQVLHSGIDTEHFSPRALSKNVSMTDRRVVVGFCGRLVPVKNLTLLIHAVSRMHPDDQKSVELRFVGEGSERETLEALAKRLSILAHVSFAGSRTDIPDQLRNFDIFVLPSHREGRPTSIMEAMSSGLPVVATNVGAVTELVDDGVTGFVIAPDNSEQLAEVLTKLVRSSHLRESLGHAGRKRAVEFLSLDKMASDYLRFYESLLSSTSSESRL